LIGKSVFDLAPHDLALVYHQADLELFANGGDQVYEAKVKYADGSRRDVIFYKAVFQNADGSIGGLIGTFLDITELKQAEAALQDQMEFSDSLLWNSGAPTFVIDAQRRIVTWNRACEILTGKMAAQMLGTTNHWQAFYQGPRPCLADLVLAPETEYPGAEMGYSGLRRSDLAQDGLQAEGWFPDLNGRERYICFNAAPIRNSKGQTIAAIETLEDITDRQKRQRELEVFSQVTTALRAARNRLEIQAIVLDHALELSRARAAVLLFLTGPGERLVAEQARGAWLEMAGMELERGQGLARVALESRQPQVHPIDLDDPRLVRTDLMQGLANLICIPLIAHDLPIGVLCLGFPGDIPDHEQRQLALIGEIAASALHRSQLHEQTERQLQRLLALRSIDLAITSSLDLRLTLKVFLEQVCAQLQVDAADIYLCRPEKGVCEYAAGRGYLPPLEPARRVALAGSWFGRVAEDGRLLTVNDLAESEDPRGTDLAAKEGFAFGVILPLVSQGRVQGMLEVFHRSPLIPSLEWYEFLDALGTQAAIAIVKSTLFDHLQRSNSRLLLAYDTTIEGWSRALDMRDKETEGHSVRVTELTLRLARAMNFPEDLLVHLRWGALLHDIGKMGVPDRILLKAGELTDQEWAIMRQHPRFGYDLLSPIEHLRPALDIPYCHHEPWDGSGYPRGLKGEQIPLAARIFAVVDVWDALRSDRPYRSGWPQAQIVEYLRQQAGSRFDPQVVEAFLTLDY
jgi:putative nucleotidyltransferase with HDIG domain